jgi:hypothetical protein
MGYMAVLRNLRNFLGYDRNGVKVHKPISNLEQMLEKIEDKDAVLSSRQLPFRFYSSYRELENLDGAERAMEAVSNALDLSVSNLPKMEGKTAVLVDMSGSMGYHAVSARSSVMYSDAAALLGACIKKALGSNAILVPFATDTKILNVPSNLPVMEIFNRINTCGIEGGTNPHKSIKLLMDKDIEVDRIVLITDEQCYVTSGYATRLTNWLDGRKRYTGYTSAIKKYRSEVNGKMVQHVVNLAGYNTGSVANEDNKHDNLMSGFSEKVFSLIYNFENEEELPSLDYIRKNF